MRNLLFLLIIFFAVSSYAENKYNLVTTISPKWGKAITSLRPALRWEKYPGAKSYLLRWFEIDPVTRETLKTKQDFETSKTEYQFVEDLKPDKIYQWQIVALDENGSSMTMSNCPSFFTGKLSLAKIKMLEEKINDKSKEIGKILGVTVRNAGHPQRYGVIIMSVQKGGIAEKYGLKNYDIIVKCDRHSVKNINDLYEQINQCKHGLYFEFVRAVKIPDSDLKKRDIIKTNKKID